MNKKYQQAVIFGTFDILHPGHISIFNYTKKLAKRLFIILARDKNIDKQTLFTEDQRLQNLQKLNLAEKIYLGSLNNPLEFYSKIKPDLAVLGYDQIKYVDLLKRLSIKIKRAPAFHAELFKTQKIKKILSDSRAGFYLINKKSGPPSFKIVSLLRKTLNLKKIGFAGTLDPLASGLMILASGKATKFLDAFHLLDKVYEAQIELGKISDTFDAQGDIRTKEHKNQRTRKQIEEILKEKFTGKIWQTPPIFSAKKINGQKAYDLARQGQIPKLKSVQININEIKILKYKYPYLDLKITCSKGTYIRSIAHDLGKKLKTGGMLVKLKRTNVGPFDLKNVLAQENISLVNLKQKQIDLLNTLDKINQYFLK